MIANFLGAKALKSVFGFFASREGKILLVVLAVLAWNQWSKMEAADRAEADLRLAIANAKAEEAAEWAKTVAAITEKADQDRSRDEAALAQIKETTDEIIASQTTSCPVPADLLERLRRTY